MMFFKFNTVTKAIAAAVIFSGLISQAETAYEIKTSEGTIKVKTYDDKAPITSKNFKLYVEDKFYDDTIFHRVIPGFMIQGGGMKEDMSEKKTRAPIENEAKKDLKNKRGTLAMARTSEINSATSQFFINLVDNEFLDHKSTSQFGYAVFGEVTEGMDVVDKIAKVKTSNKGMHSDVPVKPVRILSVRLAETSKADGKVSDNKTSESKKAEEKKETKPKKEK